MLERGTSPNSRLGRVVRLCVFTAYVIALICPNALVVWVYPDWTNVAKLLLSATVLLVWHLAFKRPSVAVGCMLPVFIVLPFVVMFILTYHEPPTTNVIAMIADTNPHEASDFANGQLRPAAEAVLASLAVWYLTLRLAGSDWRALLEGPAQSAADE